MKTFPFSFFVLRTKKRKSFETLFSNCNKDNNFSLYRTNQQIVLGNNGGARVITGSQDSSIRVWSLTGDECLACYEGHTGSVLCIAMSCDRESAISGSEDKTVRVWDLKTKNCATFKGHGGTEVQATE